MKCKICPNEKMEFKPIDVPFWKDGELVVIENVNGYECPLCGERVFDKETTANILEALKNKKAKRYIRTAIYSLK